MVSGDIVWSVGIGLRVERPEGRGGVGAFRDGAEKGEGGRERRGKGKGREGGKGGKGEGGEG